MLLSGKRGVAVVKRTTSHRMTQHNSISQNQKFSLQSRIIHFLERFVKIFDRRDQRFLRRSNSPRRLEIEIRNFRRVVEEVRKICQIVENLFNVIGLLGQFLRWSLHDVPDIADDEDVLEEQQQSVHGEVWPEQFLDRTHRGRLLAHPADRTENDGDDDEEVGTRILGVPDRRDREEASEAGHDDIDTEVQSEDPTESECDETLGNEEAIEDGITDIIVIVTVIAVAVTIFRSIRRFYRGILTTSCH